MFAGFSIGTDRAPSTAETMAEEAAETMAEEAAETMAGATDRTGTEGRDASAASATIAGSRATWIHWLKAFREGVFKNYWNP